MPLQEQGTSSCFLTALVVSLVSDVLCFSRSFFSLSRFVAFTQIDAVLQRQSLLLQAELHAEEEGYLQHVVDRDRFIVEPLLRQRGISESRANDDDDDNDDDSESAEEIVPQTQHVRSLFWSTLNLSNDVVSPSIVAFPYYFGLSLPMVLLALLFYGLLCTYTLMLLRKMCARRQIYTFSELCLVALGRAGFGAALLCVFIFNWGGSVASSLILGDVGMTLLAGWCSQSFCTRTYLLVAVYVLSAPLAFFKSIGRIAVFSTISQMCQMIAITALIVMTILHAHSLNWTILESSRQDLTTVDPKFLGALGGLSYMYTCHDMSLHVLTSLKNASFKRWSVVSTVVPLMLLVYCGVIGILGFLYVGSTQNLLSDPAFGNRAPIQAVRILMCIACTLNVPFNLFMPRVAVLGLLQAVVPDWTVKQVLVPGNRRRRNIIHVLVTVGLLVSSCAVSVAVQDLGTFVSVIGVSGICIGLIFPAICYFYMASKKDAPFHRIACIVIVTAGVCSSLAIFASLAL